MPMLKTEKAKKAENELREVGAVLEKKEDRHGETKSGWWMDDVWLAPTNQPVQALAVLRGE
jgi:hypothetical protein